MSFRTKGPHPRLIDKHMRVVLTPAVAQALNVRQGDYVAFTVDGPEVRLRKVNITLE